MFPAKVMEIEMMRRNEQASFGLLYSAATAMMSPAHQVITRRPLYGQSPPVESRLETKPLAGWIGGLFQRWQQRTVERQALLALDDRMLRDIGLERADALSEGQKPFWCD